MIKLKFNRVVILCSLYFFHCVSLPNFYHTTSVIDYLFIFEISRFKEINEELLSLQERCDGNLYIVIFIDFSNYMYLF